MTQVSPEHDFARFVDEGDLLALARVFDRLAPQLLLVAAHVVRDAALAEDLVQTTFLEAIRHARRYERGRALLPWLTAILVRHAANARRRLRRPLDAARLRERAVQAPADAAQAHELADAVARALDELPRHYCQVLTLRLVHDLQPVEIAHALGCPPDTVKTRLRRGLELLRRLLPAGFTLPAALLCASGRGLAAVRHEVLRLASARTVTLCTILPLLPVLPLLPLAFGALAMKKILLALGLTACALLLGTWIALGPGAADGAATSSSPPALHTAWAQAPASRAQAPASERRAVGSKENAPGVTFTARCLDAESGAPLPGCRFDVVLAGPLLERVPAFEDVRGENLGSATSGADGTLTLRCRYAPDTLYCVRLNASDRLGRRRFFDALEPRQVVDLGDVRMRWGAHVQGRILDRAGRAVPGFPFQLFRTAQGRFDPCPECRYVRLRTDEHGRFDIAEPLAPGSWWLLWREYGLAQEQGKRTLTVRAGESLQPCEIVAPIDDDRQTIRGTAVDPRGEPIENLLVAATGGGTYGHAFTDAQGRFAIFRVAPYGANARGPVELSLRDNVSCWNPAAPPCAWGDGDVRLVLQPAAQATVRPMDARTGEVLRACELRFASVTKDANGQEQLVPYLPPMERLASGEVCLRALAAGVNVVRVEPRDPDLVPSSLMRFTAVGGPPTTVVVEVHRPAVLAVLVVDAAGAPVEGADVEAFQTFGTGVPDSDALRDNRRRSADVRWWNGGTALQPFDGGRTDPSGRVTLRATTEGELLLWVHDTAHLPRLVPQVSVHEGMAPLRVQLETGAALRGRITPLTALQRLRPTAEMERLRSIAESADRSIIDHTCPQVIVRRIPSEQDHAHWQADIEVPLAGDGTFAHGGIPEGTYDICLHAVLPAVRVDGEQLDVTMTRLELRAGEERLVEHDLGAMAPGELCARILVNGVPWTFGEVSLHTKSADRGAFADATTDAQGCFTCLLLPGTYTVQLEDYRVVGGTFNFGYWRVADDLQIAPNASVERTFHVRRVKAHVHILDAQGKPAANLAVALDTKDRPRNAGAWQTDAAGWFHIDNAPLAPFHVIVASPNAATGLAAKLPGSAKDACLGPLQVPEAGTQASFELRLPDGWR